MVKLSSYAICVLLMLSTSATAENVDVKYRGEVPLDSFECHDITRSSFIHRVCYDADQDYMVIKLLETYYHYCEIGSGTVDDLLAANSMGTYYNNIKGTGTDGPFDCRTHRVPEY